MAFGGIISPRVSYRPVSDGLLMAMIEWVSIHHLGAHVKYRLQLDLIVEQSKSTRDGFYLPLKFYVPLSIVSYFNEVQNACFDPFTRSCPQPPSYYHLPLIFAFTLLFIFLALALRLRGLEGDFSKGLALGTIVGLVMFFVFMLGGFWGWDVIL